MTIDASIPLAAGNSVRNLNIADIAERAERVRSMRAQRERQQWEWEQAREEAGRKGNARNTLAELILSQTPNLGGGMGGMGGMGYGGPAPTAQPGGAPTSLADFARMAAGPPQSEPVITGPEGNSLGSVQPLPNGMARPNGMAPMGAQPEPPPNTRAPGARNPWVDYVHLDPEGAVDYQTTFSKLQREQFEQLGEFNEAAMQILGGVYDQASYDRAKNKARALYGRYGMNLDDFGLPDEYSPELIRSLQMEGMQTRDQLDAIRRERETDWRIEDAQIDNERLSERESDLANDRAARRTEARRAAERRDATTRRGQDRPRTGGGSASTASRPRPTATGPNGQKVEWDGRAWVPVRGR